MTCMVIGNQHTLASIEERDGFLLQEHSVQFRLEMLHHDTGTWDALIQSHVYALST